MLRIKRQGAKKSICAHASSGAPSSAGSSFTKSPLQVNKKQKLLYLKNFKPPGPCL